MLKNRKIQMLVTPMLIVAAFLVTLSAVRSAAPANEEALIPVTGNEAGLAQYHRIEWRSPLANPNGLDIYYRSERMQAYPSKSDILLAISNEAGLAQYHRSERETFAAIQNGLAIYHQSERKQAVNWDNSSDPLYKYHQSEWFGK